MRKPKVLRPVLIIALGLVAFTSMSFAADEKGAEHANYPLTTLTWRHWAVAA